MPTPEFNLENESLKEVISKNLDIEKGKSNKKSTRLVPKGKRTKKGHHNSVNEQYENPIKKKVKKIMESEMQRQKYQSSTYNQDSEYEPSGQNGTNDEESEIESSSLGSSAKK